MHRTPEQWSKMQPSAVLAGSDAQRLNVFTMIKEDVVSLGRILEAIKEAVENSDPNAAWQMAHNALTKAR